MPGIYCGPDTALLEVRNLSVAIAGKTVCHALNFSIKRGECWGMLGRNGAGKTTLLHTLAGLRSPQAGTLHLQNQLLSNISRRHIAQCLGVLFQHTDDPFPSTVEKTALMGRHPYLTAWSWESEQDHQYAHQALAQMELGDMASRQVDTLSGGERQRLAIASLLTQDPQLFLLDEPTNHLDLHHQIMVMNLLMQHVRQAGKALLMILHDVNMAMRYCDHVLLLGNEQVLYGETHAILTQENIENLYRHPVHCIEAQGRRIFIAG